MQYALLTKENVHAHTRHMRDRELIQYYKTFYKQHWMDFINNCNDHIYNIMYPIACGHTHKHISIAAIQKSYYDQFMDLNKQIYDSPLPYLKKQYKMFNENEYNNLYSARQCVIHHRTKQRQKYARILTACSAL